ncbi:hypothetical protein [Alteromonas gilva]|uniref:Uncharacterized protein n=1 Tax=Alteromonas gilva TaxID=2987522 RepID=A0ABT5L723_9ALTE|nr:hypothetical protein [Alteromonas gilva]MDC8832857.1 hypothetical protein [Alteromonas gilva]
MSITFKITIPKGELFDHLQGREGRARNYELYRLAMNGLVGARSVEGESQPIAQPKSTQNTKTSPSAKAIEEQVLSEPSAVASTAEQGNEEVLESSGNVDFGTDLLSIQ